MMPLINLSAMTPHGMCFLFAVLYLVSLYIMLVIFRIYYRRSIEKFGEALREQYLEALEAYKARHRHEG